jgi:hypothetical protein
VSKLPLIHLLKSSERSAAVSLRGSIDTGFRAGAKDHQVGINSVDSIHSTDVDQDTKMKRLSTVAVKPLGYLGLAADGCFWRSYSSSFGAEAPRKVELLAPSALKYRMIYADPKRSPLNIQPGTGIPGADDPQVVSYGETGRKAADATISGIAEARLREEGRQQIQAELDREEGAHDEDDPYSLKGSGFTKGSAAGQVGVPPIQRHLKTDPKTGEPLPGELQETMKGADQAEQEQAWRVARAEKGQEWAQRHSPKRDPE